MAFNLRRAIVRNGVLSGGVCLVAGIGYAVYSGGGNFDPGRLLWPCLLALGVGVFASWQVAARIKKGVLGNLPRMMSYAELTRGKTINGIAIKWEAIEDYALQLQSRGFMHIGDFTTLPLPKLFVGVAACYVDRNASTLVEVQYIQMLPGAVKTVSTDPGGLHVSITSSLGGNISASTSDHKLIATNYLLRGDYSAMATFPGMGILQLLDKHAKLLSHLRDRSGKEPMFGLNMNRYLLLQRERFSQVRKRLKAMNGYQIAAQIDAFEAAPRTNWATSSAILAALPDRPFTELEKSDAALVPTIVPFDETVHAT
jgi:hypothetical protein